MPQSNASRLSTLLPVSARFPVACLVVLMGILGTSVLLQTMLGDQEQAGYLLSRAGWLDWVQSNQWMVRSTSGNLSVEVPLGPLLLGSFLVHSSLWIGLGLLMRRNRLSQRLSVLAWRAWRWWLLPGLWELLNILSASFPIDSLGSFLLVTQPYWLVIAGAAWMTECRQILRRTPNTIPELDRTAARAWVIGGMVLFFAAFYAMNVQLWNNLLIPHGDSVMYEEHLWNLLHGKGFRSYLDQGLFLGEHIQVAHLLLLPVYLLWPSHLLLELAETALLASTAWPVYRIALRHSQSGRVAAGLSIAWLLSFPLQYLDIAIDLKTFRPINFGLLFLLLAIDQWECRRWKSALIFAVLTLTAKEDYAILLCLLGLWLTIVGSHSLPGGSTGRFTPRRIRRIGAGTAVCSLAYLWFCTRVAIPWFRDGDEVHYARYFQKFGNSLDEVATTMLTRPGLVWDELVTIPHLAYLLALLVPLGFTPLLSPTRFLVSVPMIVLLCLNELSVLPYHHFHAPVLPVLAWSAAAGLGRLRSFHPSSSPGGGKLRMQRAACFTLYSAFLTGLMFGISPLSVRFWDQGSVFAWKKLYQPLSRAESFARIEGLIPQSARVASTDFVHPRYTHHERSYDYSEYPRRVSNYELRVPEDTQFIVIDTRHPYSRYRSLSDVREYRRAPQDWEVLPDRTGGDFIVLRRR